MHQAEAGVNSSLRLTRELLIANEELDSHFTHFHDRLHCLAANPTDNRKMTSLLQDLAREYQAALVGFGQVFLASAGFVAIACLLKWCLLPKRRAPIVRKPRQRKAREMGTELAKAEAERSSALAQSHSTAMTPHIAVSRPMPPEAHWQRAVAPVRRVIACGERARELHDRAFVRLEAADYAFQRLLLEIAPFTAPIPEPEVHQPTLPIVVSQEHAVRLAA